MITIRKEKESDLEEVYKVNSEAFETTAEAELVNRLRKECSRFISLVAEQDDQIVGHILFTPVEFSGNNSELILMGLAPMAVLPEVQNRGIGSELVKEGLKKCALDNIDAVFVLGHPQYYPKFGFVPAGKFGIKCEYEVPDEAFMAIEIKSGILNNLVGIIRYQSEFNTL